MKNYIFFIYLIFVINFFACDQKSNIQPEEKILAQISDKTISLNEFIRRAEYTIRPDYCRGDNYIHRKIVLNSLIAEKLLSVEAGETNQLIRNEQFQLYIQGRKEQAMRQWMYYNDFFNKVKPDTNEVKKIYNLSNRIYKLAYYTVKDSNIVQIIRQKLESGTSFEQTYSDLGGLEAIPQRGVSWDNPEHEVIHEALFSNALDNDQVIGPIKIDKENYITIKVLGWTNKILISDQEILTRYNDVAEKIQTKYANNNYSAFVSKVMEGKKVQFDPVIFRRVVNTIGPAYIKSEEDKRNAFNKQFWNKNNSDAVMDNLGEEIEQIRDQVFLTLDNQVWTVDDLIREMTIHPLVFRKRRIKRNKFGEQFKFAIVDMIRDKFVTQEAYKKGFDKVNVVKRNTNMWKDYLNALYYKNEYLKSNNKFENFTTEFLKIVEENLNPLIDSLQIKYSEGIEVNTDLFEQIKLTSIDMFVIQKNVPFGVIVPSFPIITTDNKLDYGQKMGNVNFKR